MWSPGEKCRTRLASGKECSAQHLYLAVGEPGANKISHGVVDICAVLALASRKWLCD
jgi:hypothetical protein